MAHNETGTTHQEEQSSRPRLKWTIMVYLAGDNSLSAHSISIMQELEAANHREDVRVLACFDSNTPKPKGARYLEIKHRRNMEPLPKPMKWGLHNDLVPANEMGVPPIIAPDFCEEDLTTIQLPVEPTAALGLSRFIRFALDRHEADRYMLILFGHGTAVAGNTFLADDNPPSFLRLKDFAKVLKEHFGKDKLDILACDNCVMNGVETAYQLRNEVDFMLGSQGLMLAVGWPYRKIINLVERHPDDPSYLIARKMLKACARRLLDYSLMDRSTEQAVCDLTRFRHRKKLVTAIKKLAAALKAGLKTDPRTGELLYPVICDAIRLARLEAQSYWDETFVDLYDFCELLLEKCDEVYRHEFAQFFALAKVFLSLSPQAKSSSVASTEEALPDVGDVKKAFLRQEPMKSIYEIGWRCTDVLKELKNFVVSAYYVGPELQYSHGVSIYFPWTLPNAPIIFEPVNRRPGEGTSVGLKPCADEFQLKTAFDEYKDYDFAKPGGGNWYAVLDKYFRATLRNVRRFDKEHEKSESPEALFEFDKIDKTGTFPVDLQKSSPDTDRETDCTCPTIKNYPRRFYLSPADCKRSDQRQPIDDAALPDDDNDHVSYLGWHIRGLVAEVIGLSTSGGNSSPLIATSDDSDPETET